MFCCSSEAAVSVLVWSEELRLMRGFCCVLVLDTLPERVLFMPAVGFALFCHSLARVSSLLLGNALFTRCGSALLSFITSFWINTHHGILDLKLLCLVVDNPFSSTNRLASCHFLRHHPIWPCLPKLLASVGAVFAPRRRCASARSSTCFSVLSRAARGWSSSTTHSRARLLWVVTPFRATTTLLVSSLVHLTWWNDELVYWTVSFSALSAPLCGSLQRRTRGLHVWPLRHHCVVVGLR